MYCETLDYVVGKIGESEICQGDLQERQTKIVRDELILRSVSGISSFSGKPSSVPKTFQLIESCPPRLSRKLSLT